MRCLSLEALLFLFQLFALSQLVAAILLEMETTMASILQDFNHFQSKTPTLNSRTPMNSYVQDFLFIVPITTLLLIS